MASSCTDEPHSPRTVTGKRPTVAALQREHEYMDWLFELQPPPRDDIPLDYAWSCFMAERERARLRDVASKRRDARWKARGLTPPAEHVDSRMQVQHDWEACCKRRNWPAHAVDDVEMRRLFVANRRKQRERMRLRKVTEQRQAAREAAGPSGRKRGRPVDPGGDAKARGQRGATAHMGAILRCGAAPRCSQGGAR